MSQITNDAVWGAFYPGFNAGMQLRQQQAAEQQAAAMREAQLNRLALDQEKFGYDRYNDARNFDEKQNTQRWRELTDARDYGLNVNKFNLDLGREDRLLREGLFDQGYKTEQQRMAIDRFPLEMRRLQGQIDQDGRQATQFEQDQAERTAAQQFFGQRAGELGVPGSASYGQFDPRMAQQMLQPLLGADLQYERAKERFTQNVMSLTEDAIAGRRGIDWNAVERYQKFAEDKLSALRSRVSPGSLPVDFFDPNAGLVAKPERDLRLQVAQVEQQLADEYRRTLESRGIDPKSTDEQTLITKSNIWRQVSAKYLPTLDALQQMQYEALGVPMPNAPQPQAPATPGTPTAQPSGGLPDAVKARIFQAANGDEARLNQLLDEWEKTGKVP